jgi:plastocyanin
MTLNLSAATARVKTTGTVPVLALLALLAIAVVAALIPLLADRGAAPRDIVLVARGMAFYLKGSSTPNPPIEVTPGEALRITVRNEDPGITHAFSIAAVKASAPSIASGKSATVTLRAPSNTGRFDYLCPPHAQMMHGVFLVTDKAAPR